MWWPPRPLKLEALVVHFNEVDGCIRAHSTLESRATSNPESRRKARHSDPAEPEPNVARLSKVECLSDVEPAYGNSESCPVCNQFEQLVTNVEYRGTPQVCWRETPGVTTSGLPLGNSANAATLAP